MSSTASITRVDLDAIKAELLAVADASHAEFPQYAHHWDQWVVAQAGPNGCTNKWGQGAAPGEYLLLNPASFEWSGHAKPRRMVTVFLSAAHNNGCDTVVYVSDVVVFG